MTPTNKMISFIEWRRLVAEAYQEEKTSTFTSDGVDYDLDKIFELVDKAKVEKIDLSEINWILEGDKSKDKARTAKVDLSVPILVTKYGKKELVVDGFHRLKKATQEGLKSLPYKRVTPEMMKASIRDKKV